MDAEHKAGEFHLGMRVSVCSDAARTRVLRFGTVKRIGNQGASWRLQGTCEWYDSTSGMRLGGFERPHYARPYLDGDEMLLQAERARREEATRLSQSTQRAAGALLAAKQERISCERSVNRVKLDTSDAERRLMRLRSELAHETARMASLLEKERDCAAAHAEAQAKERSHAVD